jgi:hypothetical protein
MLYPHEIKPDLKEPVFVLHGKDMHYYPCKIMETHDVDLEKTRRRSCETNSPKCRYLRCHFNSSRMQRAAHNSGRFINQSKTSPAKENHDDSPHSVTVLSDSADDSLPKTSAAATKNTIYLQLVKASMLREGDEVLVFWNNNDSTNDVRTRVTIKSLASDQNPRITLVRTDNNEEKQE